MGTNMNDTKQHWPVTGSLITQYQSYLEVHDGAAKKCYTQEDRTGHLEDLDLSMLVNVAN
jgi:hypothetical protein